MQTYNQSTSTFSPLYNHKIIERVTTFSENRDGSKHRSIQEKVVVEFNEDTVNRLLEENNRLKFQLTEANFNSAPIIDFESCVTIILSIVLLFWY